MKTIKQFTFTVVALLALSFSFTSCDALSEALSKEVEVEAPAIDFSVGGTAAAPQQKVGAASEVVWLDREVDITSKLTEELAKSNLKIDNVKGLKVTASTIEVASLLTASYQLGNLKIYIDGNEIATAVGDVSITNNLIQFTYTAPYDMFSKLGAGKVQIKITSDKAKPNVKFDMKLLNKYLGKVSLI